jgi:phosphatidylinositol alpha-1,6-mannosyltransferase
MLTVGRLVPRKGHAWFVERVLPRILAVWPEACYVMVGAGPEEQRIRSLVARSRVGANAFLLGRVPSDDAACAYAGADLFIMPNLPWRGDMEGFGLVALESAAHGLPVLAADLEGIRDAVVPGHTGYLLKSGDAELWSATVLRLLADQRALKDLGAEACATAQAQYTWSKMADQYESLFRDLVSENSR